MGSRTKLDIETDQLASAAGKASATMTASVITTITPPPPAALSQLDAALAGLSGAAETRRLKLDATDSTWATKQQLALATSPPLLAQQDQQAAADMGKHASTFPMPGVKPPIGPPDTGIVRPASYSPAAPKQGPWDLEDGEWELDEYGSPQPIWPKFESGGASSYATGHAPI